MHNLFRLHRVWCFTPASFQCITTQYDSILARNGITVFGSKAIIKIGLWYQEGKLATDGHHVVYKMIESDFFPAFIKLLINRVNRIRMMLMDNSANDYVFDGPAMTTIDYGLSVNQPYAHSQLTQH